MPTGKVKWFDTDRGFGFLATDEGEEVFLPASALPPGLVVRPGARVEFGVAEGRKGKQALSVRVLEAPATVTAGTRHKPEDMAVLVEDLIGVLDRLGNDLRRGRYPERTDAAKKAALLRAFADQLEA